MQILDPGLQEFPMIWEKLLLQLCKIEYKINEKHDMQRQKNGGNL